MIGIIVGKSLLSIFSRSSFRRVKVILQIHFRATLLEILLDFLRALFKRESALLVHANEFAAVLPFDLMTGTLVKRLNGEEFFVI